MKTKLFLHMGPGFHADIERELYGKTFSNIIFWNQPKVTTFHDLVSAAVAKVNEVKPEVLICHSFGAQIVLAAIDKMPSIKEIVFLNCGFDPFECFLNMAKHVPAQKMDSEKAKSLRSENTQGKMEFIFGLATSLEFPVLYWTSKEKMLAHQDIFAKHAQLEIPVFAGIFPDYLEKRASYLPHKTNWNGKVTIYFSKHDILLDEKKDIEPWKQKFPQSKIIALTDVGHYSHIENADVAKLIFS